MQHLGKPIDPRISAPMWYYRELEKLSQQRLKPSQDSTPQRKRQGFGNFLHRCFGRGGYR
jgi:hypothetical protein